MDGWSQSSGQYHLNIPVGILFGLKDLHKTFPIYTHISVLSKRLKGIFVFKHACQARHLCVISTDLDTGHNSGQ